MSRTHVRYVTVAGAVTLGYLALVSAGLWLNVHYMLAIVFAQIVTIAVAFPVYRKLVFASESSWRVDLMRFMSVWSSGMVAGLLATPAQVQLLGVPPLIAQVTAIAVVSVGSYLGHRYISFPNSGPDPATDDGRQ